MRPRVRLLVLALLIGACGSSGECEQSADCPDVGERPGVCLEDLDRGERYCTGACDTPATPYGDECPAGRACGFLDPEVDESVCIERIGTCGDAERCTNGLDDDCDGTTDGSPCEPITCFSDLMCGEVREFACVRDGSTRACAAMLRERNVGASCSIPADCYSGHCSYGYCEEACGPPGASCGGGAGWCLFDETGLFVCLRDCGLGCGAGQACFGFLILCDDASDSACYVRACAR